MNIRATHPLLQTAMPDVHGSPDHRRIAIQRVGVRGIRYPLRWRLADGAEQPAVGSFDMYVALPAEQKGTHMSRFVALLEENAQALDATRLYELHRRMLERLEADSGSIDLSFTLFVKKQAPVSAVESLMDYEVRVAIDGGAEADVTLQVVVPVTSLCPCSKEISDYGAHNQRSHVTVLVRSAHAHSPEALIRLIEDQASCELYGLLKRVDEKYVTERAYDNPKFVEDLARDVAARMAADARIRSWIVEVENFESIHNHSAYARIEG